MGYNILTKFKANLANAVGSWLRVVSANLVETSTIEGFRFNHSFDISLTATGVTATKYFLYLNPPGSNMTMALQERRFKSLNGSCEMEILWDVESYEDDAVLEETFNQWNIKGDGLVEISEIAPPVLGIGFKLREPDFISGVGTGVGSSGDISSGSGFRMYGPGTYFIFKVTNLHNLTNRVIVAYDWLEVPAKVVTP